MGTCFMRGECICKYFGVKSVFTFPCDWRCFSSYSEPRGRELGIAVVGVEGWEISC